MSAQDDTEGKKSSSRLRLAVYRGLIVAALAAVLEVGVRTGWLHRLFFSSPSQILESFVRQWTEEGLSQAVLITLSETLMGFALGGAMGVFCGLALSRTRVTREVVEPFIVMLYSTPMIALAPLFVLWFGLGVFSKVAMGSLLVFLTVVIPVYNAALHVDQEYIDTLRVLGATPNQIFLKVIVPACSTAIYGGMKLGIGIALIGATIGEFVGAKQGVGRMILFASGTLDTPTVFLGILILMTKAFVMNEIVTRVGQVTLIRWRYHDEKRLRHLHTTS